MTPGVEMAQSAAFIDTSMDTKMAVPFYHYMTIRDLKSKQVTYLGEFEREHFNYFPESGQIMVNSLTVKCESLFYHLPESLPMKHIYDEFKGKLFIHADVCLVDRTGTKYCDPNKDRLADSNPLDCAVPEEPEPTGITDIEKNGSFLPDSEMKFKNSSSNGPSSSEAISVTTIISKYLNKEVQSTFDDASKLPKYHMGNSELRKHQVRNFEMKKRLVRNLKTKKCGTRLEPNVTTPSNEPKCLSLGNIDYGMPNDHMDSNRPVWKRILMASVKLGLPVGSSSKERPSRNSVFEISDGED